MKKIQALSLISVILPATLILSSCGSTNNDDVPGNGTNPTVSAPSEGVLPEDPNIPKVSGMAIVVPADNITLPDISAEVLNYYTPLEVASGAEYAIAFSNATAYDDFLWKKIVDSGGEAEIDRSDVSLWIEKLTPQGREKFYELAGQGREGLENFFVLPDPAPEDEFPVIPFRPVPVEGTAPEDQPIQSHQYKVTGIGLGPVSSYSNKPTLKISLEEYVFYDWKNDGRWVAVFVKRTPTYYLVSTNSLEEPWLVEDWETPPGEGTPTKPFERG